MLYKSMRVLYVVLKSERGRESGMCNIVLYKSSITQTTAVGIIDIA